MLRNRAYPALAHFGRRSQAVSDDIYDGRVVPDPSLVDFFVFPKDRDRVKFSAVFNSWLDDEPQLHSYVDACDSFLCNPTCPLPVAEFLPELGIHWSGVVVLAISASLLLVPAFAVLACFLRGRSRYNETETAIAQLRSVHQGLGLNNIKRHQQVSLVFQNIEYWPNPKAGQPGRFDKLPTRAFTGDGPGFHHTTSVALGPQSNRGSCDSVESGEC